jgi:hypothetical protein
MAPASDAIVSERMALTPPSPIATVGGAESADAVFAALGEQAEEDDMEFLVGALAEEQELLAAMDAALLGWME